MWFLHEGFYCTEKGVSSNSTLEIFDSNHQDTDRPIDHYAKEGGPGAV